MLGGQLEQLEAFAGDHIPAGQGEQTVLTDAEQFAARKEPAAHALEAQAAHGAMPVADQEDPLTQGGTSRATSAALSVRL